MNPPAMMNAINAMINVPKSNIKANSGLDYMASYDVQS